MRFAILVAFLFLPALFSSPALAQQQSRDATKEASLRLLFLGDDGPHQPKVRFDAIEPVFAENGIDLTYTEDVTDALTADRLSEYDGLVVYANIDAIDPAAAIALLRYVDDGGGFIPLHSASHCFRNSPEVIALIGGQFDQHGTGVFTTVAGAPHPIMDGFGGFASWDETYLHKNHNPDGRTVLEYRRGEPQREGQDQEPWTWVRNHGEGRVFYTAWGHDLRTWENPGFQNLLERGVRWACGGDPSKAGAYGERERFIPPGMTKIEGSDADFDYVDVGPKIPNYTPGAAWGTQEKPKTLMQKPLPPEQSMKHYVTPKDFSLELVAAESESGKQADAGYGLGGKPIYINWDEQGLMWVCETIDYPNELRKTGEGRDRIRVCEDTDGDGVYDRFDVFAEGLSIPTALAPWKGGVIVQDGTRTLYLKDTEGDRKADIEEVLISDWALGDTHGGVSNLRYGHDNWFWGMQGYNNSSVVIGDLKNGGEEQLPFRQGFFRFKLDDSMPPKVTDLEFLRATDNNTWGLGFSEEGLVFGSTANHNPSVFMPIPNRYYEAVRGWTSDRLSTIADTHLFDPITDKVRQVDHHGGYTAGAGHALYTARTYPQQWWNQTAFVAGPTGHLVGTFVLQPDGAGFTSTSPMNLVASDDEWAAPIVAEVGPDGNVWVLDWYNFIVQHNPTPQGFETGKGNAYESDLRDKTYGRVYRVQYGDGSRDAEVLKLSGDDPEGLVTALKHPVMGTRLNAQRLLIERGETDVVEGLIELLSDTSVDEIGLNVGVIHALNTLDGLGALKQLNGLAFKAAVSATQHDSGGVRRVAVSVLPNDPASSKAVLALLDDNEPQVVLAALLKLADLPPSNRTPSADRQIGAAVVALLQSKAGQDRWLRDAATAAAAKHAGGFLASLPEENASDALASAVRVVSEHFARGEPSGEQVSPVLVRLSEVPNSLAAAVVEGISAGWEDDYKLTVSDEADAALGNMFENAETDVQSRLASLASSLGSETLSDKAKQVIDQLTEDISDEDQSVADRVAAAESLARLAPANEDAVDAVLENVTPDAEPSLAAGLLKAASNMDAELILDPLLELIPTATPAIREAALTALLARPDTTTALLDAMRDGDVAVSDLSLTQRQELASHPSRRIRQAAEEVMKSGGGMVNEDRDRVRKSKLFLAEQSGDSEHGKQMYAKHCAVCHVFRGEGKKVGPVLDGMSVHPKAELLTHILDPGRSVEGNYRLYTVLTVDGQVLSGMLANETRTSLQIIDSKGESASVLREDVDEILGSRKSVMPEGFETLMSDEDLSDLLTYLTDIGPYVPIPIEEVATTDTTQGMFYDRRGRGERILMEDWSPRVVEGVPFVLVDPEKAEKNAIMLRSPVGPVAAEMPESVTMKLGGSAKAIHMLSGIGGWSARAPGDRGTAMVVRLTYDDGTTEDHELKDGVHFADYNGLFDVPGSKLAFTTNNGNYQVRYLSVEPARSDVIKTIEFRKGVPSPAPIVMAVTIER